MHQYVNSWLLSTPKKKPARCIETGHYIFCADRRRRQYVTLPIHRQPTNPICINLTKTPVIYPADTHPSVILYRIASRDLKTAKHEAKQYNFVKAYGSYQDLLDDPAIDFVYISVPNSLHYEWAVKALKAGKHVLCEKPFTANADEARKLVKLGREKGLVVEEAVSYLISSLFSRYWGFG